MAKNILILSIGIILGLFFGNYSYTYFIQSVNAEVAGMDAWDLKHDYDFKKAVKDIIADDCQISGNSIYCY